MKSYIDLTGPEGNAWALVAQARRWARQLGWDHEDIVEDMMAGDRNHLLDVFEDHFGEFFEWNRDEHDNQI